MFVWVILLALCLLVYLWFLKGLLVYIRAVKSYGTHGVILVYKPMWSTSKYMIHRRQLDGDSLAEIKSLIAKQPDAKIIIYCYQFVVIQNVIDPAYIKKITTQYVYNLEKMRFVFHNQLQKSLIFAKDSVWKNSRKIISNVFHFENLKRETVYVHKIVEQETRDLDTKKVNLIQLGMMIAGRVVIHSMIGEDFEKLTFGQNTGLQQTIYINRTIVNLSMKPLHILRQLILKKDTPPAWLTTQQEKDFLARILSFKAKSLEYLSGQYQNYKSQYVASTKFLEAYFQEPNCEMYFDQIIQQFVLFLFAGQDTTGNWMQQCFIKLGEYPQYQQLILDEWSRTKELSQVKSLNNFMTEANRLSGPIRNILIRKVVTPFTIDGFTFRKGSFMTAGIGLAMFNPKHFDSPLKFDPQRWNSKQEDIHSYLPFSAGPKNCIGQHMARIETRQAIISVLTKYKLQRTQEKGSMLGVGNVSYHETNNYLVKFIKRRQSEQYCL